jgi:hypothetical protein
MSNDLAGDIDFLGLERLRGTGYFEFTVTSQLSRLDGRLYGGTAIAVSVAVAELVSERSALWMTTQFVSTVETGTPVGVEAEILAPGKRTNQVRVTGKSPTGARYNTLLPDGHVPRRLRGVDEPVRRDA